MNNDIDSGWVLEATDKSDYSPPALANGMIGLVPSAMALQLQAVILNGVYDTYGRGNVSNIVQGILFAQLDLQLGRRRLSTGDEVSDWQQRLDLKEACLTTRFTFARQLRVEHKLYALRHLPYSALVTLSLTALEDVQVTVYNQMALPSILTPQGQSFKFYHEVPGHRRTGGSDRKNSGC